MLEDLQLETQVPGTNEVSSTRYSTAYVIASFVMIVSEHHTQIRCVLLGLYYRSATHCSHTAEATGR